MLIPPPYVGNGYCTRNVDANLCPKGCRVKLQSSDDLNLFVRAFHHFEKGRINRRSMLVNFQVCTARDKLRLRYNLRIRNRTTWNRSIGIRGKPKDDDQDKCDVFQHDFLVPNSNNDFCHVTFDIT